MSHDPLNSIRDELERAGQRYTRRIPATPAVSAVLSDGSIVETVHQVEQHETAFCVWKDLKWRAQKEVITQRGRLVPYAAANNLLVNEVVRFPSEPADFGDVGELLRDVQGYIHRYVDVSASYEKLASVYVLLSWVYDAFQELPYLRLLGDPGSGKTRFLLVVGAVCYKPIFASGASTVSPLFRILDAVRGTLIIDEGDFAFSDERAEIVKILNNGNARGFPVLRSEVSRTKEFNPTAYWVYGPKLIATRDRFDDPALESRCLTEEMGSSGLREDVPIHLPSGYKEEALELRNKLLMFRFRYLERLKSTSPPADRGIEPRLAQVFGPLLAVVEDEETRQALAHIAREQDRELQMERGTRTEAQVLEVISDLLNSEAEKIAIKDITNWFSDRYGEEYDQRVTSRWIGQLVRRRLHIKTKKSNGIYVIPVEEHPKIKLLLERYGVRKE